MEQEVVKIRQNLKAAQDKQKSYADKHRVKREFSVRDNVYLRVRANKISLKLGSVGVHRVLPKDRTPSETASQK